VDAGGHLRVPGVCCVLCAVCCVCCAVCAWACVAWEKGMLLCAAVPVHKWCVCMCACACMCACVVWGERHACAVCRREPLKHQAPRVEGRCVWVQ
jgi:hypothetical protein